MRLRFRKSRPHTFAGFQESASSKGGRIVGFFFGIPFFAAGVFFCWIGAVKPILNAVESGSWPQVECRIASSEVERNSGDDGDTYKVAITFTYTYEDREYTGGSYDFSDMSSSGYDGKAKIVKSYPVGRETQCWVNPGEPTIAVLDRSIPRIAFFILPFSSVFILIGAGVMLGTLGLLPGISGLNFQSRHKRVVQEDRGEMHLKPSAGPIGKFIGAILIALFWNGIISVFLWQMVAGFQQADPDWFLTLFLIPFVVIGLVMIGAVFYFGLALLNPAFRLTLAEGSPRLGDMVRLRWHLNGSTNRLQSITFTLQGRESATYRAGTRSVTDKSLFFKGVLFETDDPGAHRNGEIDFLIPADLMHSFSGGNNAIKWTLQAHGSIARWPDVNEAYTMTVRPRKVS